MLHSSVQHLFPLPSVKCRNQLLTLLFRNEFIEHIESWQRSSLCNLSIWEVNYFLLFHLLFRDVSAEEDQYSLLIECCIVFSEALHDHLAFCRSSKHYVAIVVPWDNCYLFDGAALFPNVIDDQVLITLISIAEMRHEHTLGWSVTDQFFIRFIFCFA